ncbi:LT_GEWL domain containing protein [uncultured Caudovirales phage]|uniref:LT_GEWL domain containing protein n=1 Tax=uncultured Caudovirales phage TaxID=2100421 RepID=A0A6J5KQX3_9CAUD|nr:LT_GEWL domain containing protein [uncultured Caudovirales phage]
MADTPNSYKDPFWQGLASGTESKLGLPKGILTALVTRGERSNNDQVSEAGAKTPFQIIPATRDAAIKKWGVDPYLSPENAAEVAGLLFKDSLDRNKGSVPLAVAEYHGGTNRANWGPKTNAYVQRVTGALPVVPNVDMPPASVGTGESTFDKVAKAQAPQQQLAAVYQAYKSGQMSPEEAQQFEADVNSGAMMLPRGAALNNAPKAEATSPQTSGASTVLPQEVAAAYSSGQMSRQEMIDLERDVSNGLVKMPAGVTLQKTEPLGVIGSIKEGITGKERQTETTNSLPDWAGMPELNDLSIAGAKTGLGTFLSNPAETAQIIKANYPGAQIRQDEKGNYVIRSSMDGKEYAIKPGFQVSDIPRALGALAAFTPAGKAATIPGMMAGAGATQAVIEGSQAATGGNFDAKDVALAAATAGIVPPVMGAVKQVAGAVMNPVKAAAARLMPKAMQEAPAVAPAVSPASVAPAAEGVAAPVAGARPVAPEMPAAAPIRPAPIAATEAVVPAAEQMGATELAQTAKKAAEGGLGSKKATQVLAEQAAPDTKTVEAAKRLGIEEYLQPDHVTTNQAYRELAQAVKSVPGSEARAAEMQGLSNVAKRADDLITEIGGSHDLAQVSQGVKGSLQATQAELEQRANTLYKQLREGIPAKTEAPAPSVLEFIAQREKDLGGSQNLTSMEKMILAKLAPKQTTIAAKQVPQIVSESGAPLTQQAAPKIVIRQPTYTLLDDVRKDVGAAARMAGPFKDADTGLAKKLYSLIGKDQESVAGAAGMGDVFKAAKQAVAIRKGVEDDLISLFGKNLDNSIVGNLNGGVRVLATGDTSKFIKLIQTIPENMRQETVASGLAAAFGKTAKQGSLNFNSYAKWYEGLLKNKQAYAAVMSNLPPAARKQLSDLYRVSKSIGAATKERITTGRIQAVTEELKGGEGLLSRVYDAAKRNAISMGAGTVAGGMLGPGVGAAIASALSRGAKPSVMKAADALIASPEFQQAVKQAATGETKQAAVRLAYSKPFTKFVRAVGSPKEMTNRERWIMQALEASSNNQKQSNSK